MKSYLNITRDSKDSGAAETIAVAFDKKTRRSTPLNVRSDYPRRKALQADLTRYYETCLTSPSARRFRGERRKQYCAGVAWKRVHEAGRYNDYFTKEPPMAKRKRRKTPPRDSKGHFIKAADFTVKSKRKSLRFKPKRRKLYRDAKGHFTDQKPRGRGKRVAPATHKNRLKKKRTLTNGKRVSPSYSAPKKRSRGKKRLSFKQKRHLAGLKAARTRKRNLLAGKTMKALPAKGQSSASKKKKKKKKTSLGRARIRKDIRILNRRHRKLRKKLGYKAYKAGAGPARLRADKAELLRRHAVYRQKHPELYDNPISLLDSAAVFFVGGAGALGQFALDAFLATHSLTGAAVPFTDAPAAGQVYNTDAVNTPIWSDWKRLVAGFGGPLVLGAISGLKIASPVQTGLRTFALGWAIMATKKTLGDTAAAYLPSNSFVQRVLGGEVQAQNALRSAAAASPKKLGPVVLNTQAPGATVVGFAGVPLAKAMGAGCAGGCGGGCAKCQAAPSTVAPQPPAATGVGAAPPAPRLQDAQLPEAGPAVKMPPVSDSFVSTPATRAPNYNRYNNDD